MSILGQILFQEKTNNNLYDLRDHLHSTRGIFLSHFRAIFLAKKEPGLLLMFGWTVDDGEFIHMSHSEINCGKNYFFVDKNVRMTRFA